MFSINQTLNVQKVIIIIVLLILVYIFKKRIDFQINLNYNIYYTYKKHMIL